MKLPIAAFRLLDFVILKLILVSQPSSPLEMLRDDLQTGQHMTLSPEDRARAEEMAKIQAEADARARRSEAAKFFKRIWLFGGIGLLLMVAVCTLSIA